MKNKLTILASFLVLAGAFYLVTTPAWCQSNTPPARPGAGAGAHFERHPAIRGAIRALEHAKIELQNAEHDFGGHRASALKECDSALVELREALKYDK